METGYEEFVAGSGHSGAVGASTRSKSGGISGARQKQRQQQQQFDKLQAKLAKLAKHKKLAAKSGAAAAGASPKKKKKQQKAAERQQQQQQQQQQQPRSSKKQQKQLKERQSGSRGASAGGAEAAAAYQNDDTLYDYGPEAQVFLRMQSSFAAGDAATAGGRATAAKERKQAKPGKLNKAKVRQQLDSGHAFGLQQQHTHHQLHHQQRHLQRQQHHQLQQQHQLYPSEQRNTCAMNATHLKNMLKLPKAHRWVFYEWFYSNLDRPLFLGPNDFQNCLRETFPLLRTRRLTRAQWSLIRKLLGKPRRCSPAFFAEERRALHERRDKIRSLQRRRSLKEGESVRELPDDLRVPMPLIIGTNVVARVRYPTDGLYAGVVDAIDGYNHCYRVTFVKQPLGTRSIPDYEVRSIMEQESIPLASYKTNHQPSRALFTPARLLAQSSANSASAGPSGRGGDAGEATPGGVVKLGGMLGTVATEMPALVVSSVSRSAQVLGLNEDDSFSGYAIRFLLVLTRLMKMVERKKRCLDDLRSLNDQAELLVTSARPASLQLVHDYSACLLGLRRLNTELRPHLSSAAQLAGELGHERGLPPDPAVELKTKSGELAVAAVSRAETRLAGGALRNLKSTDLVTQLVALLSMLRRVAERRPDEQDYGPVRSLLAEVKASLHSGNVSFFENTVEVHLQAVLARLDDDAPLHPFHLRAASNYF